MSILFSLTYCYNSTWRRVQVMKILITQPFPASCHSLSRLLYLTNTTHDSLTLRAKWGRDSERLPCSIERWWLTVCMKNDHMTCGLYVTGTQACHCKQSSEEAKSGPHSPTSVPTVRHGSNCHTPYNILRFHVRRETRGSVVGWGYMLQTGRSRVDSPRDHQTSQLT
jgi:hypothetical protein